MIFLLAYLYVHYVIFVSLVMDKDIKLMNTFGYWLIPCTKCAEINEFV